MFEWLTWDTSTDWLGVAIGGYAAILSTVVGIIEWRRSRVWLAASITNERPDQTDVYVTNLTGRVVHVGWYDIAWHERGVFGRKRTSVSVLDHDGTSNRFRLDSFEDRCLAFGDENGTNFDWNIPRAQKDDLVLTLHTVGHGTHRLRLYPHRRDWRGRIAE